MLLSLLYCGDISKVRCIPLYKEREAIPNANFVDNSTKGCRDSEGGRREKGGGNVLTEG